MNKVTKFIGNLFSYLDFAQGNKTKVMLVFTIVSAWFRIDFDVIALSGVLDALYGLTQQADVMAGLIGTLYGGFMKLLRPLVKWE